MERWIRSLLAMFVLLALAAQAQRADKKGGKARGAGKTAMQQIDANGDGQVDDEEAENFARTRAEHLKKQLETIVRKFDANGDGLTDEFDYDLLYGFGPLGPDPVPSFEEWQASGLAFDANGDGLTDEFDYDLVFFGSGPFDPGPFDPDPLPTLEEWLASGDAIDANGDDATDVLDYDLIFGFGLGLVFTGPTESTRQDPTDPFNAIPPALAA